jgi:uncharacterized protein (DUF2062 family)
MSKTRLSNWIRSKLPTHEQVEQIRWLAPISHLILRPALWRFHRRSVPRGVALGLAVGIFLMIPGVQLLGAALLSVPLRANIPLAVSMTLLSNPVTTPLILLASMKLGNILFGFHADMQALAKLQADAAPLADYAHWAMSDAAPSLITGLAVIALVAAAVGYAVSIFIWRWWISHKWRHRKRVEG